MSKRKRPREEFLDDLRPLKKRLTWNEGIRRVLDEFDNPITLGEIVEDLTEIHDKIDTSINKDGIEEVVSMKISRMKNVREGENKYSLVRAEEEKKTKVQPPSQASMGEHKVSIKPKESETLKMGEEDEDLYDDETSENPQVQAYSFSKAILYVLQKINENHPKKYSMPSVVEEKITEAIEDRKFTVKAKYINITNNRLSEMVRKSNADIERRKGSGRRYEYRIKSNNKKKKKKKKKMPAKHLEEFHIQQPPLRPIEVLRKIKNTFSFSLEISSIYHTYENGTASDTKKKTMVVRKVAGNVLHGPLRFLRKIRFQKQLLFVDSISTVSSQENGRPVTSIIMYDLGSGVDHTSIGNGTELHQKNVDQNEVKDVAIQTFKNIKILTSSGLFVTPKLEDIFFKRNEDMKQPQLESLMVRLMLTESNFRFSNSFQGGSATATDEFFQTFLECNKSLSYEFLRILKVEEKKIGMEKIRSVEDIINLFSTL